MSRWLQSVNSLLENLDGRASEVVVDTQGLQTIIGNLQNRGNQEEDLATEDDDEDPYDVDDDDYDDDDDDDDDDEEDEKEDPKEQDLEEEDESDLAVEDLIVEELNDKEEEEVGRMEDSIPYIPDVPDIERRLQHAASARTVSDISFSTLSDYSLRHNEDQVLLLQQREGGGLMKETITTTNDSGKGINNNNNQNNSLRHNGLTDIDPIGDGPTLLPPPPPPQTPDRLNSSMSEYMTPMMTNPTGERLYEDGEGEVKEPVPVPPRTPTRPPPPPPQNKFSTKTPSLDQSPRFPRRTIEDDDNDGGDHRHLPRAGSSLLADDRVNSMDVEDDKEEGAPVGVSKKSTPVLESSSQPPRIPPTSPNKNTRVETNVKKEPSTTASKSQIPASNSNKGSSKENLGPLKEKLQALQAQLTKTTTELKTSQSQIQALSSQTRTLETKLEAANAEIQAQAEELRRAGERMEKDRVRAQEEREDLLDEQEEELEQVHQRHKDEVDGIRKQYESQIMELTNQLHTEETKRRKEGGDYTQELQDAIERERIALKQLNDAITESTQFKTDIARLEQQQSSLQTKLDVALQSVKTATEREREAEDKLDASISLHSKQTIQRQSREAELEKTIFELGTALTLERQRQQPVTNHVTAATSSDSDGEMYKNKFEVVSEEVESLKVQLNMETQRREALQEELNDISKERSEEASNVLARQRLQDRKVSEMEMTISRLKTQVHEQKSKPTGFGSMEKDPKMLYQELDEARRDIESLSGQVLRHQAVAENSKSEILALKGRLQATVNRAEQAEKSLQTASMQSGRSSAVGGGGGGGTTMTSSSRLYEMEGGGIVGGMRRRVKGGRNRNATGGTISAALQISPTTTTSRGSTSPLTQQVGATLDALDSWMVDTGSFMRHEPLARLAFMTYLIMLHLWTFALVIFHTVEEPHADFGSLDANPRHWRVTGSISGGSESHPQG